MIIRLASQLYTIEGRPEVFARMWPQPSRDDNTSWFVEVKKWFGPVYRAAGSPLLVPDSKMKRGVSFME